MPATILSRRINEFIGVALFASALLWLVSLSTYHVSDGVWFFNSGGEYPPTNFFGQVGAFVAELSYQTLGYCSFLIPATFIATGWSYFWCRPLDAAYTKLIGTTLLFSSTAALLSLSFGTLANGDRSFDAGGYLGTFLSYSLAEYFNRTGSIIVILTIIFLSIILSTHFSFGRFFPERQAYSAAGLTTSTKRPVSGQKIDAVVDGEEPSRTSTWRRLGLCLAAQIRLPRFKKLGN